MSSTEAETKTEAHNHGNMLKGMKIRDEFLCPITCELLREPVVAQDGHSYEKNAIERWFSLNKHSPKSGQTIDPTLIPNLNLKRVIQDMINEGGASLYTYDANYKSRLINVSPQKVLSLKCLGPPESDWYMKSFDVTSIGCIGGRKHQTDPADINSQDMIIFRDSTVSRKHFEIIYNREQGRYYIRDLGSAGGTFYRILTGQRKELHPGMMILLGKHQFNVSSISDAPLTADAAGASSARSSGPNVLKGLVSDAEKLVADFEKVRLESKGDSDIEKRLRELTTKLSSHVENEAMSSKEEAAKSDFSTPAKFNEDLDDSRLADAKTGMDYPIGSSSDKKALGSKSDRASKRCVLTCFFPDGSPLQGKNFFVDESGATVGRRQSNQIALFVKMEENGEERMVNIDGAVSAEHATIQYDSESERFYIRDGVSKPSTNGTWIRISGPYQESPLLPITAGMEFLIGTIRFQVSESMTIREETVADEKESASEST